MKVLAALKRRRRLVFIALSLYVLTWGATALWGVRDVRASVERTIPEDVRRLDSPPWSNLVPDEMHEPPWAYQRGAWSPCPFVVSLEVGIMAAPMLGTGSRIYFFWFGGSPHVIYERVIWNS
jgi:hypothetical protein